MSKKQSTMAKLITSLFMALVLCLGVATPVFAAGEENGPFSTGSEDASAGAAITKMLNIAEGTEIPDCVFTFTFTPKFVDEISVPVNETPTVLSKEIEFSGDDMDKAMDAADGVVSVPKETAEDVFKGIKWPHAGVYVYTVKETKGSDSQYVYSEAQYDVYVYVANKEDGSGLFVEGVASRVLVNDEANAGSVEGEKVDPTPGGGPGFEFSQMIFTNTYTKRLEEKDPTNEANQKLNIGKAVTGAYGDLTKYFDFDIDLKKPATINEEINYKAYVVEMVNGRLEVVTSKENHQGVEKSGSYGDFIFVTTGTPITIHLKHGQQLAFTGIHDGASYMAEEGAAIDYKASVVIKESGSSADVTLANDDTGKERSTAPDNDKTLMRIVNGYGNKASFTNQYKEVSPMGIGVDNLPLIMMIVIVAVAATAYAALEYRKGPKAGK